MALIRWVSAVWRRACLQLFPEVYRLGGGKVRIDEVEAGALDRRQIRSYTDLWSKVGQDYGQGLADVSTQMGKVSEERLVALLQAQVARDAEHGGHFLNRHIPDFIGLGVLVVFAVLFVLRGLSAVGIGPGLSWTQPQVNQLVVAAPQGLPRLRIVAAGDVRTEVTAADPDAVSQAPEALVGQVTLSPLQRGAVIHRGEVMGPCPGAPTIATTEVISLPIRTAVLGGVTRGSCVSLVLASRDRSGTSADGAVLELVRILDINRSGDNAILVVVARVSEKDRLAVQRLLAVSDIYVFQPQTGSTGP